MLVVSQFEFWRSSRNGPIERILGRHGSVHVFEAIGAKDAGACFREHDRT
jgi:hypothetical protein